MRPSGPSAGTLIGDLDLPGFGFGSAVKDAAYGPGAYDSIAEARSALRIGGDGTCRVIWGTLTPTEGCGPAPRETGPSAMFPLRSTCGDRFGVALDEG